MTTPYYHGQEQQYTFYQLPKQLLKDAQYQDISLDARILYCLLLDRMQLSQKNGWQDEAGRTYIIYTQNEIMKDLSCSSRSVTRMLKDLEEAGMIARKRQTMYRPWWIYVHPLQQSSQKETSGHFQTASPKETKGSVLTGQKEVSGDFQMASPERTKGSVLTGQKEVSGDFQMASPEGTKGSTNKNNINNTEYSKTEESDNDFSKNRKAEAEEAPARQQADEEDSCAKLSPYLEHQYELEMAYARKGTEAEAAKQTARQDWWPENFQELSLDQRAEVWRKQARKQPKE